MQDSVRERSYQHGDEHLFVLMCLSVCLCVYTQVADFGMCAMATWPPPKDSQTEEPVSPIRQWPGMTTLYAAREILE